MAIEKTREAAIHYLLRRGVSIQDAEDAVQEAWVRGIRSGALPEDERGARRWIQRVGRNEALRELARHDVVARARLDLRASIWGREETDETVWTSDLEAALLRLERSLNAIDSLILTGMSEGMDDDEIAHRVLVELGRRINKKGIQMRRYRLKSKVIEVLGGPFLRNPGGPMADS